MRHLGKDVRQVDMQVWTQGRGLRWRDKVGIVPKTMGLGGVTYGVNVGGEESQGLSPRTQQPSVTKDQEEEMVERETRQ